MIILKIIRWWRKNQSWFSKVVFYYVSADGHETKRNLIFIRKTDIYKKKLIQTGVHPQWWSGLSTIRRAERDKINRGGCWSLCAQSYCSGFVMTPSGEHLWSPKSEPLLMTTFWFDGDRYWSVLRPYQLKGKYPGPKLMIWIEVYKNGPAKKSKRWDGKDKLKRG